MKSRGQWDRGTGGRNGRVLASALLLGLTASSARAQTWRNLTSARQAHGETALDVNVQYGAGRFTLGAGDAGTLYRMDMRYDEDRYTPLRDYDPTTGTLRLGIRSREGSQRISLGDRRRDHQPSTLDLTLAPGVPLDLSMDLGAVQADMDLGGLSVRRLQVRTGASESRVRFSRENPADCDEMHFMAGAAAFRLTGIANANCRHLRFDGGVGEVTLDFTGAWRRAMVADVTVSFGQLTLELPRDVGVSLRLNRVLASFEHQGFTKRGSTYYSANYDTSRYHLTLNVNATIGGVDVVWVDR